MAITPVFIVIELSLTLFRIVLNKVVDETN